MIASNTLADILLRHAPKDGNFNTKIKGLLIARRDTPHVIERCILRPTVIITVQGKKHFIIGERTYTTEPGRSIILGMDLPADCIVQEGSSGKPYCSGVMDLDPSLILQIAASLPKEEVNNQNLLALTCAESDPGVLEAFTRLAELLDAPEHIPHLAQLRIEELHYRLLVSPLGRHIRTIHFLGTQANQIARAIQWLEKNYKYPLKIENLANEVNMAVSTFHRNFKLVTTLSPLQFQKKLRLFEAQRLMLIERMDALNASYEVGYESPTQFNREYKRMFGNSPVKDIKNVLAHAD